MSIRGKRRPLEEKEFVDSDTPRGTHGPDLIRGTYNNDLREIEDAINSDPKSIEEIDPKTGGNALHIAVLFGNFSLVNYFTSKTAIDIFRRDFLERDTLDLAIQIGHPEIKQHLFALFETALKRQERPPPPRLVP